MEFIRYSGHEEPEVHCAFPKGGRRVLMVILLVAPSTALMVLLGPPFWTP